MTAGARGLLRHGAVVALLLLRVGSAEAAGTTWDEAFPVARAPAAVHFQATYVDARGAPHSLEVWRDGDRRLRRRTDDALDLFVERAPGGEYAYRLVDHVHKALLGVSRTNLYRIGVFTDWSGLAHVVTVPSGAYRLVPVSGVIRTPVGTCNRVRIEREGASDEVCWSGPLGLPLRIRREVLGAWKVSFELTRASRAVDGRVFRIETKGLRVVDADADIDPSHEQ